MFKRIGIALLTVLVGASAMEIDTRVAAEFSFVSSAQARVGRPLTPVSVAGVARRTARRCVAGVYYC